MKKLLTLFLIIFTSSEIALAQFGGPPNGGGGDGNGRRQTTQQALKSILLKETLKSQVLSLTQQLLMR